VDITANLKEATRNGAKFTKSHHDCPYCGGHRTLTIVGSQAASLAAVMVGQLFSSGFNQDKKLIAFSDFCAAAWQPEVAAVAAPLVMPDAVVVFNVSAFSTEPLDRIVDSLAPKLLALRDEVAARLEQHTVGRWV
jgi:hypothetical protein